MNRRAFLSGRRVAEVSCERLFMKYIDARMQGRVDEFVASLERELLGRRDIRFSEREWLADDEFRDVLRSFMKNAKTGSHA